MTKTKFEYPTHLYHYTSIDTFSKIISNRQIRFNRLDKVNDPKEGKSLDFGDLGIYIFVSCWTDTADEIVPLWKNYSTNFAGVRIKLPTMMFKYYKILPQPERAFNTDPNFKYVVPQNKIHGKDYIMAPIPKEFPNKIVYTDDWDKITPVVKSTYDENLIHMGKLGTYKTKDWSYENEWRFQLRIMPAPPPPKHTYLEYIDNYEILAQRQFNKRQVSVNSLFLDLTDDSIKKMEITIGPCSSNSDYLVVKDILLRNNLNNIILNSSLQQKRIKFCSIKQLLIIIKNKILMLFNE